MKPILKNLLKEIAAVAIPYAALWTAATVYAQSLPKPETDKLAILIAEPVRWYDYGQYFPGVKDIYVHRVEQAFGKRAVVYDPATKENLGVVLRDESISDMVIAGHGSWDSWQLRAATESDKRRSDVEVRFIQLPKGAQKKRGLFVRHTCGLDRGIGLHTLVEQEVAEGYLIELKDATNGKVKEFTKYNEQHMRVIVYEGMPLGKEEEKRVDQIIKKYFENELAKTDVRWSIDTPQLGEDIVENRQNVRGWQSVTNPLLFLWDPIPKYVDYVEDYKVTKRDKVLAAKEYRIISEMEYDIEAEVAIYSGKNKKLLEHAIDEIKQKYKERQEDEQSWNESNECTPTKEERIALIKNLLREATREEEELAKMHYTQEYEVRGECPPPTMISFSGELREINNLPHNVWSSTIFNFNYEKWGMECDRKESMEAFLEQCLPAPATGHWIARPELYNY